MGEHCQIGTQIHVQQVIDSHFSCQTVEGDHLYKVYTEQIIVLSYLSCSNYISHESIVLYFCYFYFTEFSCAGYVNMDGGLTFLFTRDLYGDTYSCWVINFLYIKH